MSIIRFQNVVKWYSKGEVAVRNMSFTISQGEFVALSGPSGSGKTTILNLAAGLDLPSKGDIYLFEKNLSALSPEELAFTRRDAVGFIFQSYNLFPVLTASENVEYLLGLNGVNSRKRRLLAEEALDQVGLTGLGKRMPRDLSGGQQQRVAIARAIVTRPKVVFADEPTASLDSKLATELLGLFNEINHQMGITFVFSSHDQIVLTSAKRILEIADGTIKND